MVGMSERIAKFLSAAGVCSRRDAERMIEAGRVAINNEVLTTPATLVTAGDLVTVDGELVEKPRRTRVFVYYKPAGVIVSARDAKGRKTLEKALPAGMPRVIAVGRLDINSEGLLLLTTNGDLAQWLMQPKGAGYERVYKVRVYGELEDWQLGKMQRGMTVDGVNYAGAKVVRGGGRSRNVWYTVTLKEGKNREIRKLFGAFNIMVSRLLRVSYGPFDLGTMQEGMVSELKPFEVKQLMTLFEQSQPTSGKPRHADDV